MPLRVTKEYSTEEVNEKKVHKKMSKNGHFQKVRRPTGLEVYNDAAKILEELLEKRIDRDVKVARQRRNKTDLTKERESVCPAGDSAPTRCKTMPSRYRESIDFDSKRAEPEDAGKKTQRKRMKNGMLVGVETDSSTNDTGEDTDTKDSNVATNRKKKSYFKRAKESLIRTFQRDQKVGMAKKDSEEQDSPVKKRKPKKRSGAVVSESNIQVKGHLNKDKSIDITEVVDHRQSKPSSKAESHSHKERSGSISRKSLIDTIRKPFRNSLQKKDSYEDEKRKTHIENSVKSFSIDDDGSIAVYPSHPPTPSKSHSSANRSITPTPPPPGSLDGMGSSKKAESSSISPSSPNRKSSPSSDIPTLLISRKGDTLSSTASTNYPMSDYNNSVGSLNVLPSVQSNMLDSPGDELLYIDDDSDKDKRKSLIKFHGSEGLLNLQWLADQTANAKAFDFAIDERSVSTQRPDGNLQTVTTLTATRTVVLPGVSEEGEDIQNGNEQPEDDNKPDMMKEEIYGKIAQKLIEMADTYSASMSDVEGRTEDAAAAISDAPLTDLEKEIIACLRAGGDKYDKKIEDQIDSMKAAITEEAYDRFRSTVQNTMGHELSWNTIALLFYATKGVVSAVGKSSQVAVQAKEFTLKYISDTFVNWIMEQGGFDSMLSASESDPELD